MNRDEDATRSSGEYLRATAGPARFRAPRAALHRRRQLRNRPLVAIGNMVCPGSRSAIGIVEIGNIQGAASRRSVRYLDTLARPDRRAGASGI
jgi:hypothetical protein